MNLLPNYPDGFTNLASVCYQSYLDNTMGGAIEDGTVPDNANVTLWVTHAIEAILASTYLDEDETIILSRLNSYYTSDLNGDQQGMCQALNITEDSDTEAFMVALSSLQLDASNTIFATCNIDPSSLDSVRIDALSVFGFLQAFRGSLLAQFGNATNNTEMVGTGNNSIDIARDVFYSLNRRVPNQNDLAVLENSFGFFFGTIVGAIRNQTFISAL